VLVPVALVGGVTMPVMDVVVVITMRYHLVAATLAVRVGMVVVGHVHLRLALVPMVIVVSMGMAVVEIIGMVTVFDGDVTAPLAVDVRVVLMRVVGLVGDGGHG
jgi:hypothetical protein